MGNIVSMIFCVMTFRELNYRCFFHSNEIISLQLREEERHSNHELHGVLTAIHLLIAALGDKWSCDLFQYEFRIENARHQNVTMTARANECSRFMNWKARSIEAFCK